MNCLDYLGDLIEWARGAEPSAAVRSHAARCPECASFLDLQQSLGASLAGLSADPMGPPDAVRARVMAEFDRSTRPGPRVLAWVAAGALAAAASLALFVAPAPRAPQAAAPAPAFVPIPYTVPLAPGEQATVVRMQIPVTALLAAGFQVPGTDPGAVVQAEVLVSQDGRARAIRPLSISTSN